MSAFSIKDIREAFAEAYQFGIERAGPLKKEKVSDICGELVTLNEQVRKDPKNAKVRLRRDLKKAVFSYLCGCFPVVKEVDNGDH